MRLAAVTATLLLLGTSQAHAAIPVHSTAFIPHHDVPTVKRTVVVQRGEACAAKLGLL